jgi:uncharacterized protein YndB with AHSA1/START domain
MRNTLMIAVLSAAAALPAHARVVQVTGAGFALRLEAGVSAPPAKVYDALVGQVGSWWNTEHTYSGDAKNLSIDARPGGCFCERLRNGGGIEHARVLYAAPGEILRMSGALGPLQAAAVTGTLTWKLTSTAEGTKLELSYNVAGYLDGGFDKIAPLADGVLGEQVLRLKSWVETGKPTQGPGK